MAGERAGEELTRAADGRPAAVGVVRRLLSLGVVGLGAVLLLNAARHVPDEPQRWSAVLLLLALGTAGGGLGLAGRRFAVRSSVRWVGVGVTIILVAGLVLLRRHAVEVVLPEIPPADTALRTAFERWIVLLTWLALAAAHAAAGLAVVPGREAPRARAA